MVKAKLFAHFLRRGYSPCLAYRLACKRYDDSLLARRMLEQQIFGGKR